MSRSQALAAAAGREGVMGPRITTPHVTIVGGGSTHWTPRLLVDFANHESLQDARGRADGRRRVRRCRRCSRSRAMSRRTATSACRCARRRASPTRSTARSSSSPRSRSAGSRACATTSRSRRATASVNPSATASDRAASRARCAAFPCCSRSRARWRRTARTRCLLNVTNPLSALCRAATARRPSARSACATSSSGCSSS